MLYFEKTLGDVWKITENQAIQIFEDRKGSGTLMQDTAWLNGRRARFCGVKVAEDHLTALWADRASYPVVEMIREDGVGYSGGHNTAAKMDWPIRVPEPKDGAIIWWDESVCGKFTTYQPTTVSLVKI